MARNALEVALAALGGGLQGFGQQRMAEQEREDRLQRQRMMEALEVAGMMERGWGTEEQAKAQQAPAARTALQLALSGVKPGAPMPDAADVAKLGQVARRANAPAVEVGGRSLRLLDTASDREEREVARRGQERAAERQAQRSRDEALHRQDLERERKRESAAVERVKRTGLSPTDRAYQETLDFSSRLIADPLGVEGPRLPTDAEVQAFADRARRLAGSMYGTGGGQGGVGEAGVGTPVQSSGGSTSPAAPISLDQMLANPVVPTPPRENRTPPPDVQPDAMRGGAIPPLRAGVSRADRWEELRRAGLSVQQATAMVNREMPQ